MKNQQLLKFQNAYNDFIANEYQSEEEDLSNADIVESKDNSSELETFINIQKVCLDSELEVEQKLFNKLRLQEDKVFSEFKAIIGTTFIENQQLYETASYLISAIEDYTNIKMNSELKDTFVYELERAWIKNEYLSYINIESESLENISRGELKLSADGYEDSTVFDVINEQLQEYYEDIIEEEQQEDMEL